MAPGLKYEVALCIKNGDMRWINNSFHCGKWNDIVNFRDSLMLELEENERVKADDGYVGEVPQCVSFSKSFAKDDKCKLMQSLERNRQVTLNSILKYWRILKHMCRHDVSIYGDVFQYIIVITQFVLNYGERVTIKIHIETIS